MATKRENLLALLRGEEPAWVPCSINLGQWAAHHRVRGTLPAELGDAVTYVEIERRLGCDIFTRKPAMGIRESYLGVAIDTRTEPGSQGPRHVRTVHTPHGDLCRITEEQTALTTSYQVQDLVADWQRDGKAYLWMLERKRYTRDRAEFLEVDDQIGADGVPLVALPSTPLKQLHIDLGLDYSCLFLMDEPAAAQTCCDLHWRAVWPLLEELAADDRVHAGCLMDNVDAPFYPPMLCALYWTPYVRQAADLFAAHGKRLWVHACGKLHQLKDVFRAACIHGLEGMAHAPIGDWTSADARAMPAPFIYNGGFSAHEQVIKSDAEVDAFYRQFFAELNGFPRFIFGAACQTTITTSWDRIRRVVDLCRKHGGQVG